MLRRLLIERSIRRRVERIEREARERVRKEAEPTPAELRAIERGEKEFVIPEKEPEMVSVEELRAKELEGLEEGYGGIERLRPKTIEAGT